MIYFSEISECYPCGGFARKGFFDHLPLETKRNNYYTSPMDQKMLNSPLCEAKWQLEVLSTQRNLNENDNILISRRRHDLEAHQHLH